MAWNWKFIAHFPLFPIIQAHKVTYSMDVSSLDLQLIITLLIDQKNFIQIKTMCGSLFFIFLECLFSNSHQKTLCFTSKLFFSRSIFLMICRNYKVCIIFTYRNFFQKLQREMSFKRKMFDHNFMHWSFCIVNFYLNPKNQLT